MEQERPAPAGLTSHRHSRPTFGPLSAHFRPVSVPPSPPPSLVGPFSGPTGEKTTANRARRSRTWTHARTDQPTAGRQTSFSPFELTKPPMKGHQRPFSPLEPTYSPPKGHQWPFLPRGRAETGGAWNQTDRALREGPGFLSRHTQGIRRNMLIFAIKYKTIDRS